MFGEKWTKVCRQKRAWLVPYCWGLILCVCVCVCCEYGKIVFGGGCGLGGKAGVRVRLIAKGLEY